MKMLREILSCGHRLSADYSLPSSGNDSFLTSSYQSPNGIRYRFNSLSAEVAKMPEDVAEAMNPNAAKIWEELAPYRVRGTLGISYYFQELGLVDWCLNAGWHETPLYQSNFFVTIAEEISMLLPVLETPEGFGVSLGFTLLEVEKIRGSWGMNIRIPLAPAYPVGSPYWCWDSRKTPFQPYEGRVKNLENLRDDALRAAEIFFEMHQKSPLIFSDLRVSSNL